MTLTWTFSDWKEPLLLSTAECTRQAHQALYLLFDSHVSHVMQT